MALRSDHSGPIFSRRIARHVSQLGLVMLAAMLLVVAGYRFTSLWLVPEVTIAFSKADSEFGVLLRALERAGDSSALRVHTRELPDASAVRAALENKGVDFAVVRSDVNFPENGMVAALLQSNAFIILTLDSAKITRVEQLSDRRIGVIAMDEHSKSTLQRLLDSHRAGSVQVSDLSSNPQAVKFALSGKVVDAIAVAGHPSLVTQIVAGITPLKPIILSVSIGDVSRTSPGITSATIAARSLPGGVPDEAIETASTSYLLVVRRDLDRSTVNTLLQELFSTRPSLARTSPLAWEIKGPDDDTSFAKLPNHRGALDYYNREQQTFMDLYGDWIWLGLFGAGGLSSALAWLTQTLSRRRKQLVENILDRLLAILEEARNATSIEMLDQLAIELDGLVTHAIRQVRSRATELPDTSALRLAVESGRAAISDRRRALIKDRSEHSRVPVR
jgi:TRAP-type uncharacterized transport system substrate-binding protein